MDIKKLHIHCTLHSVHCTVYSVHCILYTVLFFVQCTHTLMYIIYFTVYTVYCTIVHYTVYNCSLYSIRFYIVQCTIIAAVIQSVINNVHHIMYNVHLTVSQYMHGSKIHGMIVHITCHIGMYNVSKHVHCTIYRNVQCTIYQTCTLYNVSICTMYNVSNMYIVQCINHVHSTMYQTCTMYNVSKCTMYQTCTLYNVSKCKMYAGGLCQRCTSFIPRMYACMYVMQCSAAHVLFNVWNLLYKIINYYLSL